FIFFPYLPHSRLPLSFPTRRSSDLSGSRPHKVRRLSRSTRSGALTCLEPGRQDSEIRLVAWAPLPFEQFPLGPSDCRGNSRFQSDRKSTRLNSSHDQISYAVFCLKK